jgi:SAM-dependent methyltransferase
MEFDIERLVPPGELIAANRIGGHADPEAALAEFRGYGRLQMQRWIELGYVRPDSHLLDVGCGLGRVAHSLPGFLDAGTYTGIDITRSSIDWCQEHYAGLDNFRFIHADLANHHYNRLDAASAADYAFPVAPARFDFIWSSSLFTHMQADGLDNYIGQMARAARPGALLWNTFFILDEVSEPLARAGVPGWGALSFEAEGGLYMTEGNPDHVRAYRLDHLRALHHRHGLQIVQIGYGGWSGRPGTVNNGQDAIISTPVVRA